ncbi:MULTISPECIES: carbohydrate ABC transporter permease [unclassified Plantibacter]|jgi:multiple sugar transport system permease protein|uniref:carbohydrate ABC transporter permease n=1 Tax=unclassified Plantibacter TaxID=2624265 RepID=UPI003D33F42B
MATTAPVTAGRRHRRDDTRIAIWFILPATIGLLVFMIWPTLRGIYLSFTNFNLLTPAEFTGFDNYVRLVQDPQFWNSLWVTIQYVVVNITVQIFVALLIAVLMQRLTKSTLLRGLVLTPYLVSNVVVALVFLWILDTNYGIFNKMLGLIGIENMSFWSDERWAIITVALVNVWRHVGYTALLLFAGLQSIPGTMYEAAKVDGAGEVRTFFGITLPLLRPILALVLIMSVIGSFQVFDTVSVATRGGPANSTNVLQLYIFNTAFGDFDFGYASALSVALLILLMIVTVIQYRMTRAGQTDLD